MPKADTSTVNQHLATYPPAQRRALQATRASLLRLLPGSEEVMAWGMPSYRIDGDLVVSFSGFAEHNSLFPGPAVVSAAARTFPDLVTTKGTIHLPRDTAPPPALVRFVVRTGIEQINAGYPKASGVTKEFYDNGFLKSRGRIKAGRMNGAWEFFRRDGSLMRSGRFAHGEQVGEWTTYDRAGRAHRVTDFG
jgi:uncharacterized protein YdhG (YjbR/CyaY superfamily)